MQDKIYQNSGDGNIHPDWECPPGDPLMLMVLLLYSEPERQQDQRNYGYGQKDMAYQNEKIKRPDNSFPKKFTITMVV
jgi:hypothetical protein